MIGEWTTSDKESVEVSYERMESLNYKVRTPGIWFFEEPIKKVFALTDAHGNYNYFKGTSMVNEKQGLLVNLGDSIDRGIYGIDILVKNMASPNILVNFRQS